MKPDLRVAGSPASFSAVGMLIFLMLARSIHGEENYNTMAIGGMSRWLSGRSPAEAQTMVQVSAGPLEQ